MIASKLRTTFLLLAVSLTLAPQSSSAAESAAELLPPTTLLFLEFNDPSAAIDSFLVHPYLANVKELELYKEFEQSPKYLQGMTILRVVEFQLGMTWRDAIRTISAGGISVAFDPATEGFVILFKAESAEKLERLRDKIVEMARKDAQNKGKPDPYKMEQYRDIDVYTTKDGGFFTHEDWLLVGNDSDLGKPLIDALLDGRADSLATNSNYKKVKAELKERSTAWGFINLEPLHDSADEGLQKLFSGKADEPVGEMLLGGILEAFKTAPYLSASLQAQENSLDLQFQMPHDRSEVSELREHYFGPQGTGQAAPVQEVPNLLFGLSAYRDLSQMWLRAGDLFNEKVNDGFAQADSNLSTFFSGKDFGEDILGALSPQIQIIAVRQTYSPDRPVPAIKIPAFALLAEMKDPETTTREFRRIYQSFIGFFNVIGAMEGQPQFDLDFESLEKGELISATPIPLTGEETDPQAKINFNFSPTVAFAGKRLVISSASSLARTVVDSPNARAESSPVANTNTQMRLQLPEVQSALEDNKSHLISQNMLKEGHTRKEAEKEIGILLEALKLFDQANLKLFANDSSLNLNFNLELKAD